MRGVQKAIAAVSLRQINSPGGDEGQVGGPWDHDLPDKGEPCTAIPARKSIANVTSIEHLARNVHVFNGTPRHQKPKGS